MNPLETFLKDVRDTRATGAAVAETSFYPALANLLNDLGHTLRPKVRCVINLANAGAGLPDGGLFTPDQFQKASASEPRDGQSPARGVVEVKSPADDLRRVARSDQVRRYSDKYGLVLLTNLREFLLLGRDARGAPYPWNPTRSPPTRPPSGPWPRRFGFAADSGARTEVAAPPVATSQTSSSLSRSRTGGRASYARIPGLPNPFD